MNTSYSDDEMLVVTIARTLKDGDLVEQGMATPLIFNAIMLAKLTHAPNLLILNDIGGTYSARSSVNTICRVEEMTVGGALSRRIDLIEHVLVLAPTLSYVEYLRPAQVDSRGNTNNQVIGNIRTPKVRLPGCGGICDATTWNVNLYLYVPRHDKRTFVEKLDFRSAAGFLDNKKARSELKISERTIRKVVTNLCVFDFDENGNMCLEVLYPGVTPEQVQDNTSFPVKQPNRIQIAPPPTEEELTILRNQIDPLNIRRLEMLSGKERIEAIKEILPKEKALKI